MISLPDYSFYTADYGTKISNHYLLMTPECLRDK